MKRRLLGLHRGATRRIGQLVSALRGVKAGDSIAPTVAKSRTEAGLLGWTLDKMAGQLVELVQEGILAADPDEIIRFVNPSFARSLGYTQEELMGQSFLMLISEDEHQRNAEERAKRQKGESSHYELKMRAKDGSFKTFLMSVVPVFNERGEFAGAFAVCVDITELKQKEEELRRSEEKFQDLYNNAPDGYHALSADGTFVEMNDTELKWLGYTREEVVGTLNFSDVTDEEGKKLFQKSLLQISMTGSGSNLEVEMVRKDGSRFPVRINTVAVFDENRNLVRCRATVRDINEQKRLEKQLLQAQKLEAIGTLAGGIAHDFNNVLTGILGFTELVSETLDWSDPRREQLDAVLDLGKRAAAMVRQLLSFSRYAETERRVLEIKPLVKETMKLIERMIPETINVRLDLSDDLLNVKADPAQLQQVLMNLCINARDAMPNGGTLSVSGSLVAIRENEAHAFHPDAQPRDYVCLSVSDTGVGMTTEVQSRIFEPFFTTKEPSKGSGLGLSVVYGIVKAHGGFITVESKTGVGSTFGIYLPATILSAAISPERPAVIPNGKGEVILFADDERVILDLGCKILRTYGYRVLTARNGEEAIETYRQHQQEISLVILDAMMPKLTGIDVCHLIRKADPLARIILVTGYNPEEEHIEEAVRENSVRFAQKPYTAQQLVAVVREVLDRR